jgi:hypothetical protein
MLRGPQEKVRYSSFPSLAALLLALVLAGCSGKGTISGRVIYKGQPLPSGAVAFYGAGNSVRTTQIDAQGNYSVTGVPAGPAKVCVITVPSGTAPVSGAAGKMDPSKMGASPDVTSGTGTPTAPKYVPIPQKYKDPGTTDLDYTVTPGSQSWDIELK